MIRKIIDFSVRNKLITGILLLIFIGWGIYSFTKLSVDALPDVTNNQVQVITNSPNLATQEVEQFITFPLETEFKSLQGLIELRSTSRSGLSVITIVFKDGMPGNITRQLVAEKVKKAEEQIPKGFGSPDIVPPTTGLGEIYQYVIVPKEGFENKFTAMGLRTIQDWIVKRQLLGTAGVVDVSSFGGKLQQYEVSVIPERLAAMGLTLIDVYNALQKNNSNTGGSYIDKGPNIYFIRGEGLIENLNDINSIVVRNNSGIPVLIKDIGKVDFGFAPRYGAMTRNGKGETVGGVVLMQKGENAVRVIGRVKERMKRIERYLPEGLRIDVFVDRTKLIDRTVSTVSTNLLEGALIVVFVLVLFLGSLRAGLIVASVIPLAMLFAVAMMNLFGVSANLMSMGALDFGLIVDGAVIIVESLTHRFFRDFRGQTFSQAKLDSEVIDGSSRIMTSAVFGQIIILIVYIPIFALSGIEGKMFTPMAQTVSFAIVGAMLLSITYVPLVSSLFLSKNIATKENITDRAMNWLNRRYQPVLKKAIHFRFVVISIAVLIFSLAILLFNSLGGEFIPELDEGDFATNFIIRQGSSLPQSIETSTRLEKIALEFPEVSEVVSKIGTSEIPTDPMPIESGDIIMVLKDRKAWVTAKNRETLAEKMKERMAIIPGVNLSFEQPIQMRFNELIAGVKSDIAIKIFGADLDKLFSKGNEVSGLIKNIRGLTDIKVEQVVGMPQLVVRYNRNKIAQYGLNISDVNAVLNTAYAGGYAGVVYEGERKFDLVVRISKDSNTDANVLRGLLIPLPSGKQLPLSEIADVSFRASPSQISREDAERRIVVEANVRGRDVESVIRDIQQTLDAKLKLPEGYYIVYGGQFQNLQEAKSRLHLAVPVALLLIFIILFLTFRSIKEAFIIFSAIPLAAIGGIVALWMRDMNFSISAGIGFIALFGVSVLNGIVLISYYNRLKGQGVTDVTTLILTGSAERLRPVLATAAVASLGFLPMAFSTSAGAEVQKPLATVVIGGLVSSTLLTLFVLPVLYSLFYFKKKSTMKINPVILLMIFSISGIHSNAQTPALSLETARETALKNHPVLQQSRLNVTQQQTLVKSATLFEPLNITSSFGQINSSAIDYYIGASQSFKMPAAYKSEKDLLQQNVNVASASAAVTKNDLIKNVTTAYYNWLYAWQQFRLLSELDSTYRDFARFAEKKFDVGESGILEKTSAKSQLVSVQLKKKQAEADIHIYENELRQWMVSTDPFLPPLEYTPLSAPLGSDSAALQANPVLVYNQQQIAYSNAAIRMEKSRGLPSVSVGGATQSIDKVSSYYILNAGINIPLFTSGVKSRTKAAQLNVQIFEKELEINSLQLSSSYSQLHEQFIKASDQLKYYREEGLQYAAIILNAANRSYKAGDIGYVEYIQNINEAISIRAGYLQTINEYNQTVIRMNYLLNR